MKLSDAEWTVMSAVWQSSPATAREVLERIHSQTRWTYSTVKSLLARLVEKGALDVEKRTNKGLYAPRITRRQARRAALRSLVEKAFDGAFGSLVAHLVADEKLSAKDRQRLTEMLEDSAREPKAKP